MTLALVIVLSALAGAASVIVADYAIEAWDRAWTRRRARRAGRG